MLFKGRENFLHELSVWCPDTEVLYCRNNIVIIKVNTFQDCNRLFYKDSIDWCIARSKGHWDDYVGAPGQEQYFIIDFNHIDSEDRHLYNNSLIGFTLKDGNLYAAHARNDRNLLDAHEKKNTGLHPFEEILKNKGIYKFVIKNKMKHIDKNDNSSSNKEMGIFWAFLVVIVLLMTSMLFRCS
jgi:hypothetical protein